MVEGPPRASRYEVLTKIATGGMATVYVGRVRGAVAFSRLVAIKRPHPFVTDDPELRQQLEAEARVASMIHHPNVVSVLDVEEIDGELVLVMDYVEGCTLKTLMDHAVAENIPAVRIAVRVILDVAAGLHAAHRLKDPSGAPLGVVHRDVSPQNVLLGLDGVARLTDFGIAKIASRDVDPTAADIMKGKMAYLAPEYVASRRFDARSDLFALGVVAWEALAGDRLFKGANDVETLMNIVSGQVPLLGTVRPELLPLQDVIATALARSPEGRHGSVLAFAEALELSARSIDGVATHAEVGALVEKAAGRVVAERRRALESTRPQGLDSPMTSDTPPTERDLVNTVSIVAPASGSASGSAPSSSARSALAAHATPVPVGARRTRASLLAAAAVLTLGTVALVMVGRTPASGTLSENAPPLAASASGAATPGPSPTALADPADRSPADAGPGVPGASAVPPSGKRPRTSKPPARPGASTLLPAHAPPNPYGR